VTFLVNIIVRILSSLVKRSEDASFVVCVSLTLLLFAWDQALSENCHWDIVVLWLWD